MKIKAKIVTFIRWLFRSYQREIKKFTSNLIDEGLKVVESHVSSVAKKKIVKDVLKVVRVDNVDIYTKSGAEAVKTMVNEYIEKLGGGE